MTAALDAGRVTALQELQNHRAETIVALDRQAAGLLGGGSGNVRGARVHDDLGVLLTCVTPAGDQYEISRADYVDGGGGGADPSSSYVYQVRILEQMALELTALDIALQQIKATQSLLDSPPKPGS